MSKDSAIILYAIRRSFLTKSAATAAMFTSVRVDFGRSPLSSSSTRSLPSRNREYHLKTYDFQKFYPATKRHIPEDWNLWQILNPHTKFYKSVDVQLKMSFSLGQKLHLPVHIPFTRPVYHMHFKLQNFCVAVHSYGTHIQKRNFKNQSW
jgi:hypothetical protein